MAVKKAPRAKIAANEADADELAGTSATGETQAMEDPEPATGSVKKKVYVRELERLQIELVKQQETIRRQGRKVVVLFEGRDARAHLNCIAHLLSRVPYEEPPVEAIVLPPRQAETGYVRPPMSEQRFVPSVF